MPLRRVRLARPLEKTVATGHPWVYRDALEPFEATPGDEVVVLTRNGRFLARGLAESGPIGVRIFSLADEAYGRAASRRLDDAFALRTTLALPETDAYRLVHGEGDLLPGVVVDRYGAAATLKLDGDAAAAREDELVALLRPRLLALGVTTLVVRTGKRAERDVRIAYGEPPASPTFVRERGMRLAVDLFAGQKTGLFLDHRESRARVRALASGRSVLNLYGYTGGFSVAAHLGGATHVTTVDVSGGALALCATSLAENGAHEAMHREVDADVPTFLAAEKRRFGLVVADPPNFAPNAKSVEAALESYRKLHAACVGLVEPGGFYLAASCSSHVDAGAFEATLVHAARARRLPVQLLERSAAPADHPRSLALLESDYLKVCLLRVLSPGDGV